MTTTQAASAKARKSGVSANKVGAVIAQFVSWLTTYWCVVWIMEPETYALPVIISIVAEALLILMKRCLYNADRGDDAIGWVGLIVDAIINAGGILPRAGRLLTFPPIAAILALVGVRTEDEMVNQVGAFLVAVGAGVLLSILPHRLWRD